MLLFVVLIFYAFYKWVKINDNFFEKRNIVHLKPKFLYGINEAGITAADFANKIYRSFPDKP